MGGETKPGEQPAALVFPSVDDRMADGGVVDFVWDEGTGSYHEAHRFVYDSEQLEQSLVFTDSRGPSIEKPLAAWVLVVAGGGGAGGASYPSGGGGGAGGPGGAASTDILVERGTGGGAGLERDITGSDIIYAAGGNINLSQYTAVNGAAGTGNGGDGGWNGPGGLGGSGVVIVRFPYTAP
jgi:hypothetical protein